MQENMTRPVIYTENCENIEYKHWASKTINFFCMWMRSTNSADISLIGRILDLGVLVGAGSIFFK